MFDLDYEEEQSFWLEEARKEARLQNPLVGYCRRVYFTRTACKIRGGAKKGHRRKYKTHEVELLCYSGKCVQVKDLRTPGLDALAHDIFAGRYIHPDENVAQVFLDYFRKL